MTKETRIYIKIQLEKNQDSGELLVKTQFDPEAPNFVQEKNDICWYPTTEEMEFMNEVFELIPSQKIKSGHSWNKSKIEKKTTTIDEDDVETIDNDETEDATENTTQKSVVSTPGKKHGDGIIVTADADTVDQIIKKKKEAEGLIVEADEETIVERVLKKKKKEGW